MKDKNTKSKLEFIVSHIWWVSIAWIWYKNILFRCYETHSLNESRWILLACILVCCAIGMTMQWNKIRNNASVFTNVIAGFGIYTVFAYLSIRKDLIIVTLLIFAVLASVYAVFIMCRKIRNRKSLKRIMIRRIKLALVGGANIISVGLLTMMFLLGAGSLFGFSLVSPSVSPAKQSNVEEQTIANNIETLALLEEESWKSLNVKEKLDVLQTVANVEQRYLGLPNELNVGTEQLREGLAGYYADRNHMIVVSLDCLLNDSSDELVNTIAHEAYHSLQYRMIDAYEEANEDMKPLIFYYDASVYKEEFTDYIDGNSDICGYYTQKVETDARSYAKSATYEYFERINEYLANEGDQISGSEMDESF